jgi:drug/metabolite transporter (DMT)-like permease
LLILNGAILTAACFTGSVVYFIGSLTWYGAISRLSLALTTAVVIPGVPILSMAFAVVFLGERPGYRELIGIIVAVIGVAMLVACSDASRVPPLEAVAQ